MVELFNLTGLKFTLVLNLYVITAKKSEDEDSNTENDDSAPVSENGSPAVVRQRNPGTPKGRK